MADEPTPHPTYEFKVKVQAIGFTKNGRKYLNGQHRVSVELKTDHFEYVSARLSHDGEFGTVVAELVDEAVHSASTHPDRPGGENGR